MIKTDGHAAWEELETGSIHLAILDWMMPGFDGLTICRFCFNQPAGFVQQKAKVVVCDSVFRIGLDCCAIGNFRRIEPVGLFQEISETGVGWRVFRIGLDCCAIGNFRGIEPVGLFQEITELGVS